MNNNLTYGFFLPNIHLTDLKHAYLAHHFAAEEKPINVLKKYSALQIDPINIVAPNQHLVIASRTKNIKSDDVSSLYSNKLVLEVYAKSRCMIPIELAGVFSDSIHKRRMILREKFKIFKTQIEDLKNLFFDKKFLCASDIKLTQTVKADGWSSNKLSTHLFYLLWQTGYLIVHSRIRNKVYYQLSPEGLWDVDNCNHTKRFTRWKMYIDSLGIVDSSDTYLGYEKTTIHDRKSMLNKMIECDMVYQVSPMSNSCIIVASKNLIDKKNKLSKISPMFIPPLDNAIWNRNLIKHLFEFSYKWEIYVPKNKRKIGAYAMPLVTENGIAGAINIHFSSDTKCLSIELSKSPKVNKFLQINDACENAAYHLADYLEAHEVIIL